ncbi:DUF5318 family protein [Corynebacterium sp. L4756]|uniref:DUF5318 family protein n=1 Tax=unclassified Corynebacterium TaxID=2624378 RepID=UPI00374CED96
MSGLTSVAYKHTVSHEWERAATLRELRAGRIAPEEVCDADFLLRAAATHHGVAVNRPCPLCDGALRNTRWVYGEELGRRAGSARSETEIAQFVSEGLEFTVHTVEVCLACRWNHLLTSEVAYRKC